MFVRLWQVVKSAVQLFVVYAPGEIGFSLRSYYWGKKLKYLGVKTKIDTGVYFQNPEFIHIDDNCWVDKGVMILAGKDYSPREKVVVRNKLFNGDDGVVYIGKNVHVGPQCILSGISAGIYVSDNCGFSAGCRVFSFSHHYRSKKNPHNDKINFGPQLEAEKQCLVVGPVFIGENTGVALNSVILPGVAIPENCFVSIASVVMPSRIRPNSILAGSPAKFIEQRFPS